MSRHQNAKHQEERERITAKKCEIDEATLKNLVEDAQKAIHTNKCYPSELTETIPSNIILSESFLSDIQSIYQQLVKLRNAERLVLKRTVFL